MNTKLSTLIALSSLVAAPLFAADDGFKPIFNGKDLTGWDGNPKNWSVQDGCLTGVTTDAEVLPYNQFLIWRGGTVKNFEIRAKIKQAGNNSGIQYRSKELKDVGQWSVGGYQCDVHPAAANNAMLYEEKGRGIVAQNGQSVIIDPQGQKWLVAQHEPVKVEVAEWNEYSVIAQGNKLTHKLNGQVTAEVVDHQADKRAVEGILALQIHRGPAMKVQIKDIMLKVLPDGGVLSPEQAPVPPDAKKIETPKVAAKKEAKKKKSN
ncbi:MAG TPA: DUF1080 domain-containing protein [Verrucomicrobiae bacterium]|jgi:hypothetical protein